MMDSTHPSVVKILNLFASKLFELISSGFIFYSGKLKSRISSGLFVFAPILLKIHLKILLILFIPNGNYSSFPFSL
jgi:hypothetical protein